MNRAARREAKVDLRRRRDEAREGTASRLGLWLGASFTVCFVTGLLSHELQEPATWIPWGPGPWWGYRVTQGLHVASGILAVPLLLAKLHVVFGQLFSWPPVRNLLHGLERGSIALLVASSVFMLTTGLMNTAQWYPWGFSFRSTHYAVAWVAIGSLAMHVGVKLPVVRRALTRPLAPGRRGFLVGVASTAIGATALTVGQSVSVLGGVALLAPRRPGVGPQGLPVNVTAVQAAVAEAVADPDWRLTVVGPGGSLAFERAELLAMTQRTAGLPIACVEGWSAMATWTGVRVGDLVALVGAGPDDDVRVTSLQQDSGYAVTVLPAAWVAASDTLLALRLGGQDLHPDHGYPARIIAPNRPGVLQTKWIARLEVLPGGPLDT